MKPILYVNGCSNTAGSELTLPGQHIRESDLELSFSKILADRWNMEMKNDAIPGQGNEAIYSQTVNSILQLLKTRDAKDIFALIGFSGISRKNFIYHDRWTKLCTGMSSDSGSIIESAFESWVLNSDKSYDLNYFSTIYIGLVKFFEKHNIKYCFFSSSFGESYYPDNNVLHENDEVNYSLFDHMKNNKNWFGPFDTEKDFHSYLLNAGFEIKHPMGHHCHLAHIEWANTLEDFILSNNLMPVPTPSVPVSWGEVIDKITILEIKLEKIKNDIANQNIKKELQYLNESIHPSVLLVTELLKKDLKQINLELWQIEDSIRDKEAAQEFDKTFIELARSVYKVNDARAELKKQINIKLSSDLVEEKSYAKF